MRKPNEAWKKRLAPARHVPTMPAAVFPLRFGRPVGRPVLPFLWRSFCARGGHEERKPVSVLFVDMVGSTARADGADPEDVRDLNQLYLHELRGRIERFGGILEKFIGDAVVAVFGAPLARDDDAERAVRAALDCSAVIAELNRKHPGLDLRVRAAVHRRRARHARRGPGEPLATGDMVNTAARLQSAAPPGGVIVDEEPIASPRTFTFDEIPSTLKASGTP